MPLQGLFSRLSDLRRRSSVDTCASAELQEERKLWTSHNRAPGGRKPLDAGPFGSTHPAAPPGSGLAACAYPLSTRDVTAAEYQQIRAQFAGSLWPDVRTAGTDYVDLALELLSARGTDGYETVWFYQRLSAACAQHRRDRQHPGER